MTDFSFDDFLETQEGEKSETTAQSDGGFSFDDFLNGAKSDSPSEIKDNPLPAEEESSDVPTFGEYDTKLNPEEERQYQKWRQTLPKNLQYEGDYDLRGYWKDPETAKEAVGGDHFIDKYKKPNHPTFSNESQYAVGENAKKAGRWEGERYIPASQKRGITMSADEMNVPQSTILSKDEAKEMGEMNANEVAARSYEQATGVDAPDNKIFAHIANMGSNVGGRLNANLQMQAAQQLLSKSGNRSDDETRGLFSKMILGATKYLGGRLFVDDALDEWDETEGKSYKTPEERTRARNEFVDELARQFIAERTATKHNANTELNNREQGFWATVLGEGPAQVGNSLPYMLGPVGIALQFAQQSAAAGTGYANDEYGFAKDGSLGVVAEGDSAGKAAVKGVASGAFEAGSEIVGGKIAGAVGKRLGKVLSKGGKVLVGKYPVIAEKAGIMAETKVGTAVSKFGTGMKNLFAWTSKKLHLENPIEENIEEWETENLNALFGTGARDSEYVNNDTGSPLDTWDRLKKANSEFFKPDNFIKMNEAMLLMMGGGAFISHMAQRGMKKEVDSFLREHKLMTDKEIASTDLQTKAQALDAWSKGLSEEEVLKKINSATSLVDKLADKIAAEPSQAQKTVTLKRHLSEMNDFNSLIERAGEIDKAVKEQGGTTKRFTVQQDENGKPKFDTTIGVDFVTGDDVERKEMRDADSGVTVVDANGTYVVKSDVTGEKFKTSNFNRAINAADAMAVLNQQRVAERQTKIQVLENLSQNEAYANRKIEVFETADQARKAIGGDFENDAPGFTTEDGTTVLILDNLDNPATALAALDKGTESDRGAFPDGVNFETVAEKDDDGEVVETRVARDKVHDVTIIENPDGNGFTVFGKDVPYTNVATVEEATALARGEKIETPKEEVKNETGTDEAPAQPEQTQSVTPPAGEEARPVEAGEAPSEVGGEVAEEAYAPSTERDSKVIQGTDRTVGEAKKLLREDVDAKIADAINELGVDIKVKGVELHGSRVRGDAKDDSDLDLVVEYSGDVKEDVLFEILNENPTDFNGIKVDINPINAEKSGSLKEYMARSEQYDAEKSVKAPTSAPAETQANTSPKATESAEGGSQADDAVQNVADKKIAQVDEKATENADSTPQTPEKSTDVEKNSQNAETSKTEPAPFEVGEAKSIKKRLEKKRNKGVALTEEETVLLGRAEEAIKAEVKAKRDASRAATLEKAKAVQSPSWMGKNAGPAETRMADLSGYLADKGHNRASLHRAIQSVRDYVKKHGALALSKNDKATLADTLAKATERLAKMKESDQAAFAERNADMPTSQLEEYLVGKPNKLLSYWREHGALLSRPRSAAAAKKAAGGKGVLRDAKFDGKLFDPDSVGADELNHFFDGMNEKERNKWLKLLFGKDTKEVSDQTVTGNDATLEELGLSMGDALDAFREAYGDFQEWRANGAESGEEAYYRNQYEEEQSALDEEFGPVAEYALDELAAREAADKEYANAMAYVENKATAKDIAVLKPSNLSAAAEGDKIRVDHHKKTFDFLGYDTENGILYLEDRVEVETDEGSYFAPETRYYRVSEDAISEITKEQANGFRNETGASDNRASDEKGASRGGIREESGKAETHTGTAENGENKRASEASSRRVNSKAEQYKTLAKALDPKWQEEHPEELAKLLAEGIDASAIASNPLIKGTDEISWPITATRIGSREDAANLFRILSNPEMEISKVIYVDKDGNIVGRRILSAGFVGTTKANIDVALVNIPDGTYGVIFSHNHPSEQGDSITPTGADLYVTKETIKTAVENAGLKLLDHIITDHSAYASLGSIRGDFVSDGAADFWNNVEIYQEAWGAPFVEKPEDVMNLVPFGERIDLKKGARDILNRFAAMVSKVHDKSSWIAGIDNEGMIVWVAALPKNGDIAPFLKAHPGANRFAILNGENAVDMPAFVNAIEQNWDKVNWDLRPNVIAIGENGKLTEFSEYGLNVEIQAEAMLKKYGEKSSVLPTIETQPEEKKEFSNYSPSEPRSSGNVTPTSRLANAPKLDDETTKEIADILGDIGGLLDVDNKKSDGEMLFSPVASLTDEEEDKFFSSVRRMAKALKAKGYNTFEDMIRIVASMRPDIYERGKDLFRRAWNFYDVETDGITIARGAEIFDALDQELGAVEIAPEPFTAVPTFDSNSESAVDAALRKTRGILSVMDRDFPLQDAAPETARLASSVAELEASGGVAALAKNPERFKATLTYNLLRSSVKPLESEKAAGKFNERPYIERAANGDAEAFGELYNYFMAENAYKGGTKGFIRSALIGAGLFDLNNEKEIERIASIVWFGMKTKKKGDKTFVYEENRDGIYTDFLKGNVDIYTTGNEEYREKHPDGKGVWSLIPTMKNKIGFIVGDIKRRYNPTNKGKKQEGEDGENKPGRGERLILNAKNDEGQELIDSIADRPFDEILTNYVDDKPATSKNPNVQKNVNLNHYEYAEGRRLSKLEQDRLNAMEVVDRLIAELKPEYSDLIRAILNAERLRGDEGFVKFDKMGGTPFVDKKSLDVARKALGLESRRFAFRIKQLFNYINHDMTRDVKKLKNRLSQINEPNKFENDDGLDVTVQAQVIDLLKEGEAVSDIAKALKISEASVRMYKTRALRAGENLPFDNALGLGDVPLNKPVEKSSEQMRLEKTESARRKSLSKSSSATSWTPDLFESSGEAQSTASEEIRRKIVEGIASGLTDEEIAKDAHTSPEIVRVERIRQSTPGEGPIMVKGKPLSEQVRYVTERNIFNNETGHFERHRVKVMMDGSEVVFALNGEPVSSIAGNELSQVERNDLFDLPAQNGGETRNLFTDLPKKPSQDMLLSPVMPLEDKEINENSNRFDNDLQRQIDGKLPKDYIYQLGRPGAVLRSTGVPDLPIQLSATRLAEKSKYKRHPFDIGEVRGLVKALQSPVAVFYYGNKEKAQNIIVEISRNGKNFLVGLSLNPEVNGRALDVNSIRSVFPKDTAEWLHWIEEGKLLYADKNKIQALIDQQRMTLADVEYLNLDSVESILKDFVNPQVESSAEKLNSSVAPLDNMRLAAVEDMVQSLVEPMKKNGYDSFGDLTRVIAAKDIALFSKVRPYLREAWNRATGQNVALTTAENIFRDYEARLAALRPVRSRGIDGRTIDTTGEKTEANPLGRALVPEDGSMQQIIDKQIAATQKTQNTPPSPAPGSAGNEKLKNDYEPEAFGSGIDDNPIAREEIIDKFRELFPDVAIRGRGTRPLGKNTAGHFEPGAGIIRSKNPVSLRTIPHEIGHYIDAAYKSMGLRRPTSVQVELYRLGKNLYGNKVPNGGYESEGFAELLKFYMQGNTEGLKKEAPAAYNWLMNDFATRKPDVMARVDAIRDLIDRFQNQSGIQAVRAMTVPNPSLGRKLVNTLVDVVNAVKPTQENWIDKGAFISKAMKASGINKLFDWREAMKKKDYAEMNRIIENHPVLKWKLYNGKAGMRAFKALEDGLTDLAGTRRYTYGDLGVVTPGHAADEVLPTFKEIFKDFTPKELDDFKTEYAVARVAKELYLDKGLPFGLTEKEIAPVLKKYANNTKFKEALDLYTHYKHGVLHLLVDAGAMSQEQFEAIVKNNPIYVKISRHMDSLDAFKKAMMRRNGKAVNERKGGSQRIEDIFDAGLVDDERVFRAAFQADLFRSIINAGKLAEQNGGTEAGFSVGANWIHEVPNAQGAVTFSSEKLRKQIVDALKKSGAEGANGETGDTLFDALFGNGENLTIFKEKPSNGKKGIVSIYGEDGRLHTYELPENNTEGWAKGLLDFTDGNTFASLFEKWGEMSVAAVRAGATLLNPVFALRNLLRDTLNAATYNQYGTFIPVVSSIEGVVKDLRDKKPAQMFQSMGLEMGGFMGRSRLAGARKSNNYLLSKNWAQAQLRKGLFKAIADVVGVTENGTRVKNFENAYDYMLKNGASDKAAQMIAGCWSLDATVDFLRSGYAGQKINKFIPFFNAGIQGIDQFLRGFGLQDPKAWDLSNSGKERAARTFMQGVSWLTTLSILGWIVSNALRDEDDPEDEELPPHERWNYISFGNFRMPIPYEAGYIFASIPKAVLETVVKGDANALPECLKMFATSFPLQAGSLHELLRNNALFAPLIDVAFNEDWKGSQIVPSYVRDSKESWEWYTRRTTGLSKDLGKALHKIIGNSYFSAPAYIDTMFDGWTGGLYSKLAKLAYGESELGFDTTRPNDWPIVGTLFRSPTATRVAGNFYDELKELERKVGSGTATVEEAGRKVVLDETANKIRPLWDENGKMMQPNSGLSRKYRFDKMDENNLKARREIKSTPTDAATLRKEGIRKLAISASNPASSEHLVENSLKMLKAGGVTLQEAKDAILRYAKETGKIKGATIGRHWLILEAVWNGKEIPDGLKRKKRQ